MTKAVTSAALGILVDEKKDRWDTLVKDALPSLDIQDESASAPDDHRRLDPSATGQACHGATFSLSVPTTTSQSEERTRWSI
jgi:hypothetical protein